MGKKNDGAIFLELPETEEWKKLGLPKELGNNLKMVYQRKEKDKPAEFLEVWNPDKEYPSSCIITNVSSTLGGFKLMQAGTEIVNMQGTSKDPKHGYNSWIDFMRAAYQKIGLENGLVGGCSVDNYIYERDENGDLLPDEKRLTKIGKFIRSTSVDELPQLFNVLKGDMSLIGPRPLLPQYLPLYSKE